LKDGARRTQDRASEKKGPPKGKGKNLGTGRTVVSTRKEGKRKNHFQTRECKKRQRKSRGEKEVIRQLYKEEKVARIVCSRLFGR